MNKKPILTVMLQAKTPERIIELAKKGLCGGADAFGLQLEVLERQYHNKETYKKIFAELGGFPVYVTNYRGHENVGLGDDELYRELLDVAECGGDIFDIMGDAFCQSPMQITYDTEAIEKQNILAEKLHFLGKRVLISTHTWCFLPYEEVKNILCAQRDRGADICKIVTMASDEGELDANFETSIMLKREFDREFLFLCGGEACHRHRRLAPLMVGGMFLCVVEHDELATPFQPLLEDAKLFVNKNFI